MGSLKVGDDIIVTKALWLVEPLVQLIGTRQKITQIDCSHFPFQTYPYKILAVNNKPYWVEGIPYSSLIEELF
jgi:hypothetical protein